MENKQAMELQPVAAHTLRRGTHVLLRGRPCRVQEIEQSKTGKHGHMKVNIKGKDLLTDRTILEMMPGHVTVMTFKPIKSTYLLLDLEIDQATKAATLNALDSSNQPYDVRVQMNDDDDDDVNALVLKMKAAADASKQLSFTVLTAPTMMDGAAEAHEEERLLEFKEDHD